MNVYFVPVHFTHRRTGERGTSNIVVNAESGDAARTICREQLDLGGCDDVIIGAADLYPAGIVSITHIRGPRVIRRG